MVSFGVKSLRRGDFCPMTVAPFVRITALIVPGIIFPPIISPVINTTSLISRSSFMPRIAGFAHQSYTESLMAFNDLC